MLKKSEILCHRGLWGGGELILEQNTEKSVMDAKQEDYGVELDLRIKEGTLGVGHDEWKEFNFEVLKDVKFIAFHIKEAGMLDAFIELIKNLEISHFLVFGMPKDELELYGNRLGYWNVAYELFPGLIEDFQEALKTPCRYIWMAELVKEKDAMKFFPNEWFEELKKANKMLVLVTVECVGRNHFEWSYRTLTLMTEVHVDMICTDLPYFFSDYAEKFE